jgi:hypothetical protein
MPKRLLVVRCMSSDCPACRAHDSPASNPAVLTSLFYLPNYTNANTSDTIKETFSEAGVGSDGRTTFMVTEYPSSGEVDFGQHGQNKYEQTRN